jgi:hypothetical protein
VITNGCSAAPDSGRATFTLPPNPRVLAGVGLSAPAAGKCVSLGWLAAASAGPAAEGQGVTLLWRVRFACISSTLRASSNGGACSGWPRTVSGRSMAPARLLGPYWARRLVSMAKQFRPDPDESPALVPPNRRPPTAVGVVTLPPPSQPEASATQYHPSRFARMNSALLGLVLIGGSVSLFAFSPIVIPLGVLAAWGGTEALSLAATGRGIRGNWRTARRTRQRSKAIRAQRRRHSRAA